MQGLRENSSWKKRETEGSEGRRGVMAKESSLGGSFTVRLGRDEGAGQKRSKTTLQSSSTMRSRMVFG